MRKFIYILLALSFLAPRVLGQTFMPRTNGTFTPVDPFLSVPRALYIPKVCDTLVNPFNGGKDSVGAMIIDTCNQKMWIRTRVGNTKTWLQFSSIMSEQHPVNWYNIKNAGADTTGTLDASPYITSAINAGFKYIYIPKGTYLISNTVQMKDSVTIKGDNRSTIIKLTKNIPAFKCGWALGGTKTTFQDFSFIGTYTDSTLQDGIFADSCNGILVSNVTGTRLAGSAIRMKRTGYCCGVYTMNAVRGNIINNCYFDSCQVGVKVDSVAEFITIANTTCTNGGIGIFTAGGSTNISACRLGTNQYGIYMTGGSNNSHGTCENTHLPHNKQYGVYITGAGNGYRFVGNMIRQSVTAEVYMENSAKMMFEHNDIGTGAIIINNCTETKFLDNLYWGPPVWTITGTAPTVIQNGETLNTISIKDVVNNNQFDISHTNKVADLAGGITKIRVGADTTVFSTAGTHYIAGGENATDTLWLLSTLNSTITGGIRFGKDIPANGIKGGIFNTRTGFFGVMTLTPSVAFHGRNTRPNFNAGLTLSEDVTCGSCGARVLLENEGAITTGQIFVGATTNAFMPRGMMIHTTGADGLKLATNGSSGQDIEFAGSVNPGIASWARFKGGTGNLQLYNLTSPPGSYNILVHELSDSGTYQIPVSSLTIPASTVIGTTTNDNASAGNIGEYISSTIALGVAVPLATTVTSNITSISLTAGDWDVTGVVDYAMTGATTTNFQHGISITSATLGGQDMYVQKPFAFAGSNATLGDDVPTVRITLASTTTIYLVAQATFSGGSVDAYGTIRARRIR